MVPLRKPHQLPNRKLRWGRIVYGLACLLIGVVIGRAWPSWHLALPLHVAHRAATKAQGPEVAIIIDDCGYHDTTMSILKSIKRPITLSVLPELMYSRPMAELAKAQRFEV